MGKHPSLIAAAVLASVIGTAPGVRAEVSAEVDSQGNYLRTVILANASVKNVRIWSVQRARHSYVPLNANGDETGDLWPTILESGAHPWIMWSHFNGTDYDLAWATWNGNGWSDIFPIRGTNPAPGDDLDPNVVLDAGARPYVVWWRNEGGVGRVYLSIYLDTHWMEPYLVSDTGTDSRYPSVSLQAGGVLVVYQTASGLIQRLVFFNDGSTITDDLNPFDCLTLGPTGPAEFGP